MSDQTRETTPAVWAVVEIMGHRKLAGRVREVRLFDKPMMQIEIPLGFGEAPSAAFAVECYAPDSIFSFVPCDEATARAELAHCSAPQLGGLPFNDQLRLQLTGLVEGQAEELGT